MDQNSKMDINFDELTDNDRVSWVNMDKDTIRAYYVDFHTEDNEFVVGLYIEGNLAKCVSSSCLSTNGWIKYAEVIARVARFARANDLVDYPDISI